MADPRDDIRFDEIGALNATYEIDDSTITYDAAEPNGSAQVGLAVTLADAKTVALADDGDAIEGKLLKVESDGKCVVQVGGYMTLPGGDGATLTEGKKIVGDQGAGAALGYIREVATATAAELGVARGRIIDADTATSVVVAL